MKIWPKHISKSGDTIVEVLIAVAVISGVLVGAFLVSQKSTLAVRDSQEHGEMLQILQGQVELVRSLALAQSAYSPTNGIFDTSTYFCVDGTNPSDPIRVGFSGFTLPAANSDPYNYPAVCKNINGRYNVVIKYDGSPPAGSGVFTFYGRWDRLAGGKNQESLVYRVYSVD